ncbi:MAG: helix-turn-helix transcriptional regulator [Campylobacterales bacterium]|nr:helix-turn-helix transcriptional regulator [Campylobacterales bacterium]
MKNTEKELNSFLDYIAAKVKEERRKRNISQLKLALILGHNSTSYVARIELRKPGHNYNLSHLFIIAREFGIGVCDLLPPDNIN